MSDKTLIKKLKDKNQITFAKFFDSYKNLVFYECFNILNDRLDAEDVLQEVFIEFFNHVDRLKEDTNLKLYIASLAKNRALDLYRKKAKSNICLEENIDNYPSEELIHPSFTLDGVLTNQEARIVSLRIIYDYSFKEISLDLNLSIGQVQGIYYQALKRLKKHYKKKGN